jgi:hypothetical protein
MENLTLKLTICVQNPKTYETICLYFDDYFIVKLKIISLSCTEYFE